MKQCILSLITLLFIAQIPGFGQAPARIISLSGSITEVLDALGAGDRIVGVDVTSDYPDYIKRIPKVSKNRSVTAESISSLRPDLVLGLVGQISPTLQNQLKSLKIRVVLIEQEFSLKGLDNLIRTVAAAIHKPDAGNQLAGRIAQQLAALKIDADDPPRKIMFIYARGAGHMSVSGTGTAVDAVIRLAGYTNAMSGFSGYKTYNTEALVAANPDLILLFDFGMSSLGGAAGIMNMPGIKLTNAGKNNKIVALDAGLLNNFSVRLPEAISKLRESGQ